MAVKRFKRAIRRANRAFRGVSIATFTGALNGFLRRPLALLVILVAVAIHISVTTNANSNVLTKLYDDYKNKTAAEPTLKWIKTNSQQTIGCLFLGGAVIAAANNTTAIILLIATTLFTVLTPKADVAEYAVESILAYLMLRLRKPTARIILLIAAVALYFSERLFKHL